MSSPKPRHLDDQVLTGIASDDGLASAAEQAHLARCPRCQHEVAKTRLLLESLHSLRPVQSSRAAIEQALRGLADVRPTAPVPAQLADSVRPGQSLAPPPGLRNAAAPLRQWLFKAGDLEVDVQAQPVGPDSVRLLGQVLGKRGGEEGLPVHLRHGGRSDMATTGRHGEFSLGPARVGHIVVLVETDRDAFELALSWDDEQ